MVWVVRQVFEFAAPFLGWELPGCYPTEQWMAQ